MVRRFHIKGFKSLEDVTIELPQLAVLVGPNAAGKSNLLDAFQMLARAGTERTLTDALVDPIRGFPAEAFTFPSGGLPELLSQPSAAFVLEADLEFASPTAKTGSDRARWNVGIAIDPDAGALSLSTERLERLGAQWQPKELPRIAVEDGDLVVRRSGGGGRPARESLGGNHTLLSDARLSGSSYPIFELVRDELRAWRTYYLDPGGRMRASTTPREVRDIGAQGEHIAPFLYGLKARRPSVFDAVRRALRSVIPTVTDLDVDLDTKRGTLDIQVTQDGTTYSSRIASEGTLRVLALCAIVATSSASGLIAFEEPENGVQPQRLDRIAELLAGVPRRTGAQLVVTTHSPSFAAAMLQRARVSDADAIGLFGVGRVGGRTTIRRLRDPGLFSDQELSELLSEPDDEELMAAMMRRGWLDA